MCSAPSCSAASAGEALRIEDRIAALGDRLQRWSARGNEHSRVSEAFFTASLLFCVGPLTVVGSIQDGLTGDYEALATKAHARRLRLDRAGRLAGAGRCLRCASPCWWCRARSRWAPACSRRRWPRAARPWRCSTSAGGVLIIGISLKLLALKDVKVGNFLPALLIGPLLVGLVSLVD